MEVDRHLQASGVPKPPVPPRKPPPPPLPLVATVTDPTAKRQRQAVLEPGMVFAFEPNACIGNHRVNIGGTVIVTSTGCEELNRIPTSVTHKQ